MNLVWKVDLEFETEAGPENRIVWTNSYYWLQDETITRPIPSFVNLWQLIGISTPSTLGVYRGRRIRQLSHLDYDVSLSTPQLGQMPVVGTPLPTSCCYIWAVSDNGRLSYHRLRGPYGYSAVDGGLWSTAVTTWIEQHIVTRLTQLPVCNYQGYPVSQWRIDPIVRPWVWRHGTQRRARSLLEP